MISVYRLSSSRFPTNSGAGAAIYGGRWNHIGTEAIYTAQSISLAALEVLAHYNVLPRNYVLTEIQIPNTATILKLDVNSLPPDWNTVLPTDGTRDIGQSWFDAGSAPVLSVPSCIIPSERNFIINPAHPSFKDIHFCPPVPFTFDSRLK